MPKMGLAHAFRIEEDYLSPLSTKAAKEIISRMQQK
jgi:hypothetical protein